MAARAYIFIETDLGKTNSAVMALRPIKEVKAVDMVTGPYDIIVVVEAADLNAIGDLVANRIHTVPGVRRTLTSLALG